MEEERVYNEMSHSHQQVLPQGLTAAVSHRTRTVSSPVPLATACSSGLQQSPAVCGSTGRPLSPGLNYGERRDLPLPVVGGRPDVFTPPSMGRLHHSYNSPPGVSMVASPSPPPPQVYFCYLLKTVSLLRRKLAILEPFICVTFHFFIKGHFH